MNLRQLHLGHVGLMLLAQAAEAPTGGTGAPDMEKLKDAMAPALTHDTPLALKLAEMVQDKSKNKPKAALELEYDPKRKGDLIFTIPVEKFLQAVGPSSTGTSNGVTVTTEGTFPFEVGGKKYNFNIQLRGGWASVKAII